MLALAAAAAPLVDWGSLLTVAVLSIVIGVVGVSVYAFGVVGVNQSVGRREGRGRPLGVALAVVCFAIAIASVVGGLFLIVDKTWKP
jgi:MFS family permease